MHILYYDNRYNMDGPMLDSLFEFLAPRGRGGNDDVQFSNELRAVLQRSREEAVRLASSEIGPEHVVLAMLASPESEASRLFTSLGLRGTELRSQLEGLTTASARPAARRTRSAAELPWSDKAKRALVAAMGEAKHLGQMPVTTCHLLLGVLGEPTSAAGRLLARHGITMAEARALVERGVGPSATLLVEIDDRSDRLIYDQIVVQIREAIATGQLRPGQRLPPIRQLADELDVAPGTVARAYNELEKAGTLVTDRARGTFVADPRQASDGTRIIAIRDLVRPAVVAAFHLGSSAAELRAALEEAMRDIYPNAA